VKIEVGKRYVLRTGWITPPLRTKGHPDGYPFFVDGHGESIKSWGSSGQWFHDGPDNQMDIVAEYIPPQCDRPPQSWIYGLPNRVGVWLFINTISLSECKITRRAIVTAVSEPFSQYAAGCWLFLGTNDQIVCESKGVTKFLYLLKVEKSDTNPYFWKELWLTSDEAGGIIDERPDEIVRHPRLEKKEFYA